MKLSKRGEYALRTMINLGIAARVSRPLVRVSELARAEGLPVKFLEQIMQQLREAGHIESQRGKHGGYRLARKARTITIGAIVRLVDGRIAPIGCVSETEYERCNCPDEAHCGLRMLMLDVRNAITGILDRYTLADVVEVTTRKMARDGVPLPFSQGVASAGGNKRRPPASRSSNRLSPTEGVVHELLGNFVK